MITNDMSIGETTIKRFRNDYCNFKKFNSSPPLTTEMEFLLELAMTRTLTREISYSFTYRLFFYSFVGIKRKTEQQDHVVWLPLFSSVSSLIPLLRRVLMIRRLMIGPSGIELGCAISATISIYQRIHFPHLFSWLFDVTRGIGGSRDP